MQIPQAKGKPCHTPAFPPIAPLPYPPILCSTSPAIFDPRKLELAEDWIWLGVTIQGRIRSRSDRGQKGYRLLPYSVLSLRLYKYRTGSCLWRRRIHSGYFWPWSDKNVHRCHYCFPYHCVTSNIEVIL